ncbi:hypothetical protein ZWY2020_019985 [Hordeum vulgare]|nr:hypothetical protein ZWY2020_019985 [Hordeum vulgare]
MRANPATTCAPVPCLTSPRRGTSPTPASSPARLRHGHALAPDHLCRPGLLWSSSRPPRRLPRPLRATSCPTAPPVPGPEAPPAPPCYGRLAIRHAIGLVSCSRPRCSPPSFLALGLILAGLVSCSRLRCSPSPFRTLGLVLAGVPCRASPAASSCRCSVGDGAPESNWPNSLDQPTTEEFYRLRLLVPSGCRLAKPWRISKDGYPTKGDPPTAEELRTNRGGRYNAHGRHDF